MVNDARSASMSPVLEMQGIDKSFVGVQALQGAGLRLFPGEVHGVMGQNGAGKSTLIKVLTGVHPADAGTIRLAGHEIRPDSPQAAQALGIATVYQEVNLCPNLSVAENILAGRMPRRWGWIDWPAVRRLARASLEPLQIDADPDRILGEYPIAVQQMVAIARAVGMDARILVLDEPTSSLDEVETGRLFALMRRLKERGVAILFVTHFLDQMYEMADRITVMRNGRVVGEHLTKDLPKLELVSLMVGRALAATDLVTARRAPAKVHTLLQARGLGRRASLEPLDLELRNGEVLGLAGLLGSGRTETARLLFGADKADSGEIRLEGARLRLRSPRDALRAGLAFCPEERKTDGIVAELSVRENIVLALQARRGVFRHLAPREQRALAQRYIEALDVKTSDTETPIGQLSGGNQQKAIIARWLATEPRLLILDEPTRGIDVAAKQEIMARVLTLCGEGLAILFISSELGEVLHTSHRVAVLRDRRKVAELPADELDEARVLRIIAGHETGLEELAA
ncbi:MAG TPA: sugar ABC transporter ATP-binding protein [Burkholderiaceae bacterium]|nr:sugar ABC transporter ATP-binding protein [Burkholderiaceae bacterium]